MSSMNAQVATESRVLVSLSRVEAQVNPREHQPIEVHVQGIRQQGGAGII